MRTAAVLMKMQKIHSITFAQKKKFELKLRWQDFIYLQIFYSVVYII